MHGLAAIAHLEHLRLEALAITLIARHEHVGQKLHLDPHFAFTLARLASTARDVEREVTRRQPARPRVLGQREELTNRVERLQIGDRIRSRRSADRRLIDEGDIRDVLEPFKLAERADAPIPIALRALDRRIEDVVHECRLAGSADTGHARQRVQRDIDVDVLQVVFAGTAQSNLLTDPLPSR